MINFFKGLFINGVGGGSLGRVAFWLAYGIALKAFWEGRDIPMYHFLVVMSCLVLRAAGGFLRGHSQEQTRPAEVSGRLAEAGGVDPRKGD
jgi:hypothetical protein